MGREILEMWFLSILLGRSGSDGELTTQTHRPLDEGSVVFLSTLVYLIEYAFLLKTSWVNKW